MHCPNPSDSNDNKYFFSGVGGGLCMPNCTFYANRRAWQYSGYLPCNGDYSPAGMHSHCGNGWESVRGHDDTTGTTPQPGDIVTKGEHAWFVEPDGTRTGSFWTDLWENNGQPSYRVGTNIRDINDAKGVYNWCQKWWSHTAPNMAGEWSGGTYSFRFWHENAGEEPASPTGAYGIIRYKGGVTPPPGPGPNPDDPDPDQPTGEWVEITREGIIDEWITVNDQQNPEVDDGVLPELDNVKWKEIEYRTEIRECSYTEDGVYSWNPWDEWGSEGWDLINWPKNKIVYYNGSDSYSIKIDIDGRTGGTVIGEGRWPTGTSVTIKAIPDESHKFVKWSDGNTNPERTIVVDSDIYLIVYFEYKDVEYDLIDDNNYDNILLVNTSDLHEYLYDTRMSVRVKTNFNFDDLIIYKTRKEGEGYKVLFIDSGGFVQDNIDKSDKVNIDYEIEKFNELGYFATNLGDEEFGYEESNPGYINEIISKLGSSLCSCNFFKNTGTSKELVLKPYRAAKIGSKKLAVIGVTFPNWGKYNGTWNHSSYYWEDSPITDPSKEWSGSGENLFEIIKGYVDYFKYWGFDYIIINTHLPLEDIREDDDGKYECRASVRLLANSVTGSDAIIPSHDHRASADSTIRKTKITSQPRCDFTYFTPITLYGNYSSILPWRPKVTSDLILNRGEL